MTTSGARHVVWASLGVLSQGAGRLVTTVLVGRLAGAGALGSMATVLALGQILTAVWPGSLGSTGVKFVAQSRGRGAWATVDQIRGHLALRSLQSSVLLGLVGAAGWSLTGGSWIESLVAGIVVMAFGTFGLVQGLLYAERRTLTSSLRETAAAALSLGLVLVLLFYDRSLAGAWFALPLAVGLLLFAAAGWPRLRPTSMGSRGRELDLFTLTSALGHLSSQGFIQLSVVMAAIIGRESAGQFAVALALCTPLTLVISPLGLALFPAVNEAVGRGDIESVRRQISVATGFLAYVLVGGGGVMILLREPVIDVAWGPEFGEAAQIFIPLIAASALGAVSLPSVNGLTASSQANATRATVLSIISALIGAATWIVLMPWAGATGIATGLMIGRGVFAVAVMRSVQRLHGLPSWRGMVLRVGLVAASLLAAERVVESVVLQLVLFGVIGLAITFSDPQMRTLLGGFTRWPSRR